MTILFAFILSIILGGILAAASLYFAKKPETDRLAKPLSEMCLKSSIVVFGVFVASVAFFGQRWLEDINKELDSANETLASMDMIQAEYISKVESIYYNNDREFDDLFDSCIKVDKNFAEDGSFCKVPMGTPQVPRDVIINGSNYLNFSPSKTIFDDFAGKIFSQGFLKKTIITDVLRKLFDTHARIQERYGVLVDEIESVKKEGATLDIGGIAGSEKNKPRSKKSDLFAHALCCSIGSIHRESDAIGDYATQQAATFCDARKEIETEVQKGLDPVVRFLMNWRLKQINSHVKLYTEHPSEQCVFKPRPTSN